MGDEHHDRRGSFDAEELGEPTPLAEVPEPAPPPGALNQIYANPEKWRIGREFLSRYTGTEPEAFQKQIVLTTRRLP